MKHIDTDLPVKKTIFKPNYISQKTKFNNGNEAYILNVVNSVEAINKLYGEFTLVSGRYSVYDTVSKTHIAELKTRTFGLYDEHNEKKLHPFILRGLMIEKKKYDNLMRISKQFNKPALYINHLQGDHLIIFNLNEIDPTKLKLTNMRVKDKTTQRIIMKPSYLLNYTLGSFYINQLETMGTY